MHRRRKPKAIYRPLLVDAWRVVWKRKSLWVFGLFAAVVSTGGVFEIGMRAFDRITKGRDVLQQLLGGSVPGYEAIVEYIRFFRLMEPWRQTWLLTIFTLVALVVLVFGILSQGMLIAQAGAKEPHALKQLLKKSEHVFWRLLAIDFFTKAASVALLMAATLPLVLYVASPSLGNGVLYVGAFFLFFPAVIILNLLSILSLILVVEHDHGALTAAEESWKLFCQHAIVMLELALSSFVVSLLIMLAAFLGAAVLFVGTTALLVGAIVAGSSSFYIAGAMIGAALIAVWFALANGIMTAWQYTVWLKYVRQAGTREGITAKLHQWWRNN